MSGDPCGCDGGAPHVCDRHQIDALEAQVKALIAERDAPVTITRRMFPIETAPKDRYIFLIGDSGYTTTPYRCEVGAWCKDKQRWLTHSCDDFTDGGDPPTHWAELLDGYDA